MKSLAFAIFIVSAFLASCNGDNSAIPLQQEEKEPAPFVKKLDSTSDYYIDMRAWRGWLGLPNIEDGVGDFALTIWSSPEIHLEKRVLVLGRDSSNWKGTAYRFDIRAMKADTSWSVTPKSGWDKFQSMLSGFHVEDLPGDSAIPTELRMDDGITYIAEVATPNLYKFTWLSNPRQIHMKNKDAEKWQHLLDFLRKELDVSF